MAYNERKKKTKLEHFILGGNVVVNKLEFIGQNLLHIGLLAGALFTGLFAFLVHFFTSDYEFYAFKHWLLSHFWKTVFMPGMKESFNLPDGHEVNARAWELIVYFSKNAEVHAAILKVLSMAGFSLIVCGAAAVAAGIYFVRRGEDEMEDDYLGGQEIVDTEKLIEIINEESPSPLKIDDVPIPMGMLARNVICIGNMGAGKSQTIKYLISQAREWGKKLIIYDPTGEFTSHFFREGIDVILNPLDARSADWSLFADIRRVTDPALISRFFVPENKKSSDPVWDNAARMLFEDLVNIVYSRSGTMDDLRRLVTQVPLEQLYEILAAHDATSLGVMNPKNERGSESVRLTLTSQPAIRFFGFYQNKNAAFSVREFMKRTDDACLFLTSSATQHDMIRPFLSVWLELCLAELMSAEPLHDGIRAIFFLDELASLGKMSSLEIALTQARKFGIVTIGGVQNLSQLDEIFGEHLTKAFVANFGTKYIMRVEEESSAQRLSKMLGEEDIDEKKTAESFGPGESRDGLNFDSKRDDRALVKYSTLMRLPDLSGFLKVAGNHPIAKVDIKFKKWDVVSSGYVPRDGLDMPLAGNAAQPENPEKPQNAGTVQSAPEENHEENPNADEQAAHVPSANVEVCTDEKPYESGDIGGGGNYDHLY